MKQKIFGTINCTNEPKNDFYLYSQMYKYINKRFNKFYYINLYHILYPNQNQLTILCIRSYFFGFFSHSF